jgi:hypothetical protein
VNVGEKLIASGKLARSQSKSLLRQWPA